MLVIPILAMLAGCSKYRIERHKRSPIFFNEQYVEGEVTREETLEDGTVLIFEPIERQSAMGRSGKNKGEPFKIREETEDGEVVLHSLIPSHLLINLLNCLRMEEYEVIYDQILDEQARNAYEARQGYEEFAEFMQRNRLDLARLLTRMIAGLPQQQVKFTPIGGDVTRCTLLSQIAEQFRFKRLDIVRDKNMEYKLLMVG